jgi:hypothetical protein
MLLFTDIRQREWCVFHGEGSDLSSDTGEGVMEVIQTNMVVRAFVFAGGVRDTAQMCCQAQRFV